MAETTSGVLYVVATPIGNREDMSPRAFRILHEVEAIVAEDTRYVRRLLSAQGALPSEWISLHAHNEGLRIPRLIERLCAGQVLALVSDAGCPTISDPGGQLVEAAHKAGLTVQAVPGPSAVTAALSVSGLPSHQFVFEGFLPTTTHPRRRYLQALARCPSTLVLFEAPHRIVTLLEEMVQTFGPDREAVVTRELTKRFESSHRGRLDELATYFCHHPNECRGEFTLCVRGAGQKQDMNSNPTLEVDRLLETLLGELPPSQTARLAAQATGRPRQQLYRRALELRERTS